MSHYNYLPVALCLISSLQLPLPVLVADDRTRKKQVGEITFTMPEGIDVERISEDRLVQWPIAATWDVNGDLIVLECHWRKESVQQQLQSKPHKIVRLRDSDSDGRLDQRKVIADSLPFPEGIEFLGKELLVAAPPQILKLSDQDQDGFFETRVPWLDPGTITHCANDLHGPLTGPDGWIYWTKGAFAQQTLEQTVAPNSAQPSKAAHIYRRHPSGGSVERLMTGGMDNPSDIAFTPDGEVFFCSTFLHHPGNGIRDGIAFAPRGSLFGKDHQVIESHVRTGPLMPVTIELGPAAPASIHFLKSSAFSRKLQSQFSVRSEVGQESEPLYMVSSLFNVQRIGMHRLVRDGAAFVGDSIDLLSTDKIDFHPVDVLEDRDGSLIVLDTGGWYDLCCPSSGSDQAIAKGGIYRVKCTAPPLDNLKKEPAIDRKNELWSLAKRYTDEVGTGGIESEAKATLNASLVKAISDPELQQIACRIIGLHRWREYAPQVTSLLSCRSLATVRTAIETLGVIGDTSSCDSILKCMKNQPTDRTLQHAAIYAMIELGHHEPLERAAKSDESKVVVKIALLALSQLEPPNKEAFIKTVVQLSQSEDDEISSAALQLLQRSPEALAQTFPIIHEAWQKGNRNALERNQKSLVSMSKTEALRTIMVGWLKDVHLQPKDQQVWLASFMASLPSESLADDWLVATLVWVEQSKSDEIIELLARVVGKWRLPSEKFVDIANLLEKKLEGLKTTPNVASALLAAFPFGSRLTPTMSEWLVDQVTPSKESASLPPQSLTRIVFDTKVANQALSKLDQVPSILFQPMIELLLRCNDPQTDLNLLSALTKLPLTKTLTVDQFAKAISNRSDEFKQQWRNMIAEATRPSTDIEKSLDDWVSKCGNGDPNRGNEVFRSAKAACSSCHRVGYIGGRLGPELSQIGKSRTRRDLVAAVVYPSLHLAQGYYPVRVRTMDDEVFNGLLSRETDTHLELICGVDKVCRIEKTNIEERMESKVSIMPSGLDQQLSATEFADLIAFLESKK